MAFALTLPEAFRKSLWKVKIRDKETREPPHVTIIWKTKCWRIDLRNCQFMDDAPSPADVPSDLVEFVTSDENWRTLQNEWDRMYPNNPVRETEE